MQFGISYIQMCLQMLVYSLKRTDREAFSCKFIILASITITKHV